MLHIIILVILFILLFIVDMISIWYHEKWYEENIEHYKNLEDRLHKYEIK